MTDLRERYKAAPTSLDEFDVKDIQLTDEILEEALSRLEAIVAECQKMNHSGVNLETHRLADAVIKIAEKGSTDDKQG